MSHNLCTNPSFFRCMPLSACSMSCAGPADTSVSVQLVSVSIKKTFCLHKMLAVKFAGTLHALKDRSSLSTGVHMLSLLVLS